MAEQPPTVSRARLLFAISAIGPFACALLIATWLTVRGGYDGPYWVLVAYCLPLVAFFESLNWNVRNKPYYWRTSTGFTGFLACAFFLGAAFNAHEDQELGLSNSEYGLIAMAVTIGIFLVALLPVRRAAQLMSDLSSEVVDSSLDITFSARASDDECLVVTTDGITVEVGSGDDKKKQNYPLRDVTGVVVRSEKQDGEFPVPGADWVIKVLVGEVVVIDVPDGQIVFPSDEARRIKRFVEERARRVTAR